MRRNLGSVLLLGCLIAVFGALGLSVGSARAQAFPTKPVRIVVPTAAGGSVDIVTRLVARKLTDSWRHGVIVDNRAGASGAIGTDAVAKAPPDGHTIALLTSTFTASASVDTTLPYDALRDFAPVTLVAYSPWVLVVHPSLPVRSVKELIALAKQRPGQLNYGSTGTGGAIHLATELFKSMTGTDIAHIPYKGTAPALNDVIGGRVELTITGLAAAMAQGGGRLRFLAVTGKNRATKAPDVPTIGESVPGYAFDNWFGVLAPRATPSEIVTQLHSSFFQALQSKELRQTLLDQGVEPVGSTPAQFGDLLRQEIGKYTKLAKDIRLRVD